jgi:hypothetical protein
MSDFWEHVREDDFEMELKEIRCQTSGNKLEGMILKWSLKK